MAGGVVVAAAGFGDDSDALGLDAEGDDLALELVGDLLEGTDVGHVASPAVFEPATAAASMAIDRPNTIDDAPACGPQRSGGRRRRDPLLRGHAFLPREEWAEGPGEESRPDVVAA